MFVGDILEGCLASSSDATCVDCGKPYDAELDADLERMDVVCRRGLRGWLKCLPYAVAERSCHEVMENGKLYSGIVVSGMISPGTHVASECILIAE